jgi:uncharacterized membrane protein YcaP (DUF421 family)
MEKIFSIDLSELLIPTTSILEMFLRGTVMYLSLVLILRFIMIRRTGSISLADLLVLVVIADAAQNAFSKNYESVTEGLVLVLTIVGWDVALDRLGFKYRWFRHFLHSAPLLLVRDGKAIRRNMTDEALTMDELMRHIREQGIASIDQVKRAYLEDDGQISVIKKETEETAKGGKKSGANRDKNG